MAAGGYERTTTARQSSCYTSDSDEKCINCALVEQQLHSTILELKSAKAIIALLREDTSNANRPTTSAIQMQDQPVEVPGCNLTNQKWKTVQPNATNNKKFCTPVTVHTEYQFQHPDHFAPLSSHNLGMQAEVDNMCKRERSRLAHPPANPTTQRCIRMRIPTIMNGKITSDNNMKPRKKSSDPQCNPSLKPKNFKVQIIGDSHLKGSATRINQYVNNQYEISSFIKPGACVDHLVHTLDSELQCLGKKDTILIDGGTNDLDKHNGNVNGTLVKMIQFILKYNNTNILTVNLPIGLT